MKYNFYTERSLDGLEWVGRCKEIPGVSYQRPGRDAALSGVKRLVAKMAKDGSACAAPVSVQSQGTKVVENFASPAQIVKQIQKVNHVCFVLDRSGSMRGLESEVIKSFNSTIDVMRAESAQTGQQTYVSVVTFDDYSNLILDNRPIDDLRIGISLYDITARGGTALRDAVMFAKDTIVRKMSVNPNEEHSFLVITMTDGEENRSKSSAYTAQAEISKLQATDLWTFTFMGPRRSSQLIINQFGVRPGNVSEWDQTVAGVQQMTTNNNAGIRAYYSARTQGATSVNNFYANTANLSTQVVASQLTDVANQCVIAQNNTNSVQQIRDVCQKYVHNYVKGAGFYPLKKTEEVQAYKSIMLVEKKTGKMYTGPDARNLLGLPSYGLIKLRPGNSPNYDVYVQSTSVNRKIDPGDKVIYYTGKLV